MPSKRDRALRGLRALRVLRDLMAPSSEYPMMLAVRDTRDTCKTQYTWWWHHTTGDPLNHHCCRYGNRLLEVLMFLRLQWGNRASTRHCWSKTGIRRRTTWEPSPPRTRRWTPGLHTPEQSLWVAAAPGRCPQMPVHTQINIITCPGVLYSLSVSSLYMQTE